MQRALDKDDKLPGVYPFGTCAAGGNVRRMTKIGGVIARERANHVYSPAHEL